MTDVHNIVTPLAEGLGQTLPAARRTGIFAAIIWQAFPTINLQDGLFDTTGAETRMLFEKYVETLTFFSSQLPHG